MTESEIDDEIRRLAPFHHDIELPYGRRTYLPEFSRREVERTRVRNLVKHAWPALLKARGGSLRGQRVLDLACNCGGFSVEALKQGADYVLGIDVVDRYLEQANFIKNALRLGNLDFKKMAVEELDEAESGIFDITFCFGILYHLENPVLGMKKAAAVTRKIMVVDTEVARPRFARGPIWVMNVQPPAEKDPSAASTALWRVDKVCQFSPTTQAVIELLRFLGFREVRQLQPVSSGLEKRYYQKRRVTFLAVR